MKERMAIFSVSGGRAQTMGRTILILLTMVMLGGCFSLPSHFVEKGEADLSTKFLLYQNAWWVREYLPVKGTLVCDEEGLIFVGFDETLNKYVRILDLKFRDDIKTVSVVKGDFSGRKHLVLYAKFNGYNFLIIREHTEMDRVMTYEFAVFIAGKLNQDTKQFAAELEREKEERKALEDSFKK